jgi:ribosomal protein S18 acetylase RimI-like enzyme
MVSLSLERTILDFLNFGGDNMDRSIEVRFAQRSDASELFNLNKEFNGASISEDKIIESLENRDELVVLGLQDSNVVGFACAQSFKSFCYDASQGEITEMYVRESFRGLGVASSMIKLLEKNLLERGVKSVKILTGKDNKASLAAYTKQGYELKKEAVLHKKI